jgi:pimeloyl-ACP methyl ester carboxylesterase
LGVGPAALGELRFPERLDQGYTLILPGILGAHFWDLNVARGLERAEIASAIEVFDWTKGPFRLLHNSLCLRQGCPQAKSVAEKIVSYQDCYPGRPVFLIGHSGGCHLAVLALEALPPQRRVTSVILLAPGLGANYDLKVAQSRTVHGIDSFHSLLDLPISMAFSSAMTTLRGRPALSAGAVGFQTPAGLEEGDRRRYEQSVRQHAYELDMLQSGHLGGHFGWTAPKFVQRRVAPLLRRQLVVDGQGSGVRIWISDQAAADLAAGEAAQSRGGLSASRPPSVGTAVCR